MILEAVSPIMRIINAAIDVRKGDYTLPIEVDGALLDRYFTDEFPEPKVMPEIIKEYRDKKWNVKVKARDIKWFMILWPNI